MAVKKRKSNWYIYLIAFAAASVIAAMILSIFWDIIFVPEEKKTTGGIKSDAPDSSNNLITLFMLSEEKAANPSLYMIVSYQPADEAVICIPLKTNMNVKVGNKTATLDQFYSEGGIKSVLLGIESTVGVECDRYVKFDRDNFIALTDVIGKVYINCAYDVLANDGAVVFETGSHNMNGTDLYTYLNYNNASYGDDYQSLALGSAAVSIVNSNLHGLSAIVIQSYFTKLMNTTDSDLTLDDYTKRQQALLFTSAESYKPGQYYIPYGETDGETFTLSPDSKATILERLKIEE